MPPLMECNANSLPGRQKLRCFTESYPNAGRAVLLAFGVSRVKVGRRGASRRHHGGTDGDVRASSPFSHCNSPVERREEFDEVSQRLAGRSRTWEKMAEGEGFEPSIRLNTVYTLSRRAPSTARPPLRTTRNRHAGFGEGREDTRGMGGMQPPMTFVECYGKTVEFQITSAQTYAHP
jgi:hypothetical protein